MKRIITYYFLVQALLCGVFITHIYHTFAAEADVFLLIASALAIIISLWNLFGGKCVFLQFALYLTFSVFVGLFLFVLIVLGGSGWISLLLWMLHSALNMYLVFYVLKLDSNSNNGSNSLNPKGRNNCSTNHTESKCISCEKD